MDTSSWALFVSLLLTVTYGQDKRETNEEKVGVIVNKLDDLLKDVSNLKQSINQMDTAIGTSLSSDDCSNGMNERCHPSEIQDQLRLKSFLGSYGSPGKRSRRDLRRQRSLSRSERSVEDLYRKRQMLRTLNHALENAERVIKAEKKRSCNLNLGFHCQTDEYSSIADLYDFLVSENSPGKKKRSANAAPVRA